MSRSGGGGRGRDAEHHRLQCAGGRVKETAANGSSGQVASTPRYKFAMISHAPAGDAFFDTIIKGAKDAAAKDNIDFQYSGDGDVTKQAASLTRLQDFGVRTVVLFTGHFSDEQLALVDDVANQNNNHNNQNGQDDNPLRVLPLAVNRAQATIAPDHAGAFETSLLSALWPGRVQLDKLPALEQSPSIDPDGDVQGSHRHDPAHPLYGVFGPDPRTFDPARAADLLEEVVAWTIAQVDQETEILR